jgi:hypothetical protein
VSAKLLKFPKPSPKPVAFEQFGDRFYCQRCDGEDFKLFATGTVNCAKCGSMMRNLLVSLGEK